MEYTEKHKEKLKLHIEALENAYDNLILVLNSDVKKEKDSGEIKLTNSQIKDYADGIKKASTTASDLLTMIRDKYTELEALDKKPEEDSSGDSDKKPEKKIIAEQDDTPTKNTGSALNDHLN